LSTGGEYGPTRLSYPGTQANSLRYKGDGTSVPAFALIETTFGF